jgi:ribosomal-protein-alanine N-acetyltransferase
MAVSSTNPGFSVRELEARDVPVLRALLAEWTPEHWSSSGVDYALASAHQFRVLVQHEKGQERLAGVAEYQQITDEGHLLGIAIVPALQRQGLGMRLLDLILVEMRAHGCVRCLLEVRRSNVAGQALYQRAKFTLDGVRKNYYPPLAAGQASEDALLFSRPLQYPQFLQRLPN